MATRRDILKWSVGITAGLVAGLPVRFASAQGGERLAVVVAKDSPLKQLTQYELKKLYLGTEITDPSGTRIVPFNQMPKSPDRTAFDMRVLGMTQEQVAQYWIDRKIRGQSGAPKSIGPADLLQRVVSKLPHAITYVRTDQLRDDVRIIAIDGKVPTDATYGLSV
jgi:ABC-type phosphate transport system substrate-binding protein